MAEPTMLVKIADSPIVSSGTLRPDHLCEALLAEAWHLGIELDRRDLWQPATAIAAHGRYGGVCLSLPPYLEEIAGDVVSELFNAINWAAPSGCDLRSTEGDGACFMWHLSIDAQAEAINEKDDGWEAKTLSIPSHWLSAIVNSDESSFEYYNNPSDYQAYQQFCDEELSDGWSVTGCEDEGSFCPFHDASAYGVLACDAVECLAMRQKPAD